MDWILVLLLQQEGIAPLRLCLQPHWWEIEGTRLPVCQCPRPACMLAPTLPLTEARRLHAARCGSSAPS